MKENCFHSLPLESARLALGLRLFPDSESDESTFVDFFFDPAAFTGESPSESVATDRFFFDPLAGFVGVFSPSSSSASFSFFDDFRLMTSLSDPDPLRDRLGVLARLDPPALLAEIRRFI